MLKVSIVTISFNQAEYLERTIKSVLGQDHPEVEYIVVDPGSTDGSRDIIERYRGRIGKIVYEPDRGAAEGLNHGFAHATGEIFAYLNADDVLLPGAVSRAVRQFEDASLVVVYGDGYFIDAEDKPLRRCFSTKFSAQRCALGGAVIMQQSSFWRSEWFHRMGGFNIENRTWWDGEFFYRVSQAGGRLRHIREYWSCFRIHGESITGSGRLTDKFLADYREALAPHVARYTERYRGLFPLLVVVGRLWKFIEDPRIIPLRLWERMAGPPAINFSDASSKGRRLPS